MTPLSVAEVVTSLLEAEPPPADKDVRTNIPTDVAVMAEIGRLEQVIRNLLTNAYRYGGPNIAIEAGAEEAGAWISVCDDGGGVPAEMREKLFDPFWRGVNAASTQGSGLGLAIVSSLVEAMNGRITCEDLEPQGLRFVVTLAGAS